MLVPLHFLEVKHTVLQRFLALAFPNRAEWFLPDFRYVVGNSSIAGLRKGLSIREFFEAREIKYGLG